MKATQITHRPGSPGNPDSPGRPGKPEQLGHHWIIECYGCPADLLNDADAVTHAITRACKAGALDVVHQARHTFTPQGVTVMNLLSQSHISVHTWPEHNYAALDIFTCDNPQNLQATLETALKELQATSHTCKKLTRGLPVSAC